MRLSIPPLFMQPERDICAQICARYAHSFYLGIRFMPSHMRSPIYALYAFARLADDLSDNPHIPAQEALEKISQLQFAVVDGKEFPADNWLGACDNGEHAAAIIGAMRHVLTSNDDSLSHVETFFRAMLADNPSSPTYRNRYKDDAELSYYMEGSAEAIALLLAPIIVKPGCANNPTVLNYARSLAIAFQLTNFIRDVRDDALHGRIYVPQSRCNANEVLRCAEHGSTSATLARALAQWSSEAWKYYALAYQGFEYIHPAARVGLEAAWVTYSHILTAIAAHNYEVCSQRFSTSTSTKLRLLVDRARRNMFSLATA